MLAPLVEAGPRAQILAKGVEALLDLRPHCPVTVTAVALVVDGRCLVAANALLPHAEKTAARSLRIRRGFLSVVRRKERFAPAGAGRELGAVVRGQRGEDRLTLVLVGLRGDESGLHRRKG